MDEFRVQKLISQSGFCSRRNAEKLIEQRRVKVNNNIVSLGDKCGFEDEIKIDNKIICLNVHKRYIIMNKQKGYVSSKKDEFNRKTIFDLLNLKDNHSSLFSVGRLDKDTTGLIIITNDGDFAQKIIHPSSKIAKEYIVQIDRSLKNEDKNYLESGIKLYNKKLAPCKIKRLSQKKYLVKIFEGKKRQIREMFLKFNYNIISLHRIKIGGLDIERYHLKYGEYKIIKKEELKNQIFNF
ncbi:MAG: pseudouridine synthase [Nanoarchaeota archaeon]